MIAQQLMVAAGKTTPCPDIAKAAKAIKSAARSKFVLVELVDPGADELAGVLSALNVAALNARFALEGQRSKVLVNDGAVVVVARPVLAIDADQIHTAHVIAIAASHAVIVINRGTRYPLDSTLGSFATHPALARLGAAGWMTDFLVGVCETYEVAADHIEDGLDEIEDVVLSSVSTSSAPIYALKRRVLELRRVVEPLGRALSDPITREDLTGPDREATVLLHDISERIGLVNERIRGDDGLLSDALDVNMTQVQVQQNNDMRQISAWAAIAAVVASIAGIYGMNFKNMPILDEPWGFHLILAIMISISAGMWFAFRRNGWLMPNLMASEPRDLSRDVAKAVDMSHREVAAGTRADDDVKSLEAALTQPPTPVATADSAASSTETSAQKPASRQAPKASTKRVAAKGTTRKSTTKRTPAAASTKRRASASR